jgi:hypothetical protein
MKMGADAPEPEMAIIRLQCRNKMEMGHFVIRVTEAHPESSETGVEGRLASMR